MVGRMPLRLKVIKALQYSDLKSLAPQKDTREATSELVIRLGGTMERYLWTINGKNLAMLNR